VNVNQKGKGDMHSNRAIKSEKSEVKGKETTHSVRDKIRKSRYGLITKCIKAVITE
jgi:hypothetical protein